MKLKLEKFLLYLGLLLLTLSLSLLLLKQDFAQNIEQKKLNDSLEKQEIVLGMSGAFEGASQILGRELYRGSMAYFDYVNRKGLLKNTTIKIKTYNDGYDPIPAIYNTIKLVEEDQVFALFNYVGTPTVTRILPLLYRYLDQHIYLMFPFTGAQPQRQMPYHDLVFNFRASYRQETEGLVENFIKLGKQKIAVFYQIDAYGRSGWEGVRRWLDQYNLDIIKEATYRRGTPYSASFQEQVNILKSAQPDAIISIGSYEACAGFIRDARDDGLNVPIANISFVGSEKLLSLLEKTGAEKGKDYTKNLINSQVVPSYEDLSLSAVREYRQLMLEYPLESSDLLQNSNNSDSFLYSFTSFEGFLNAKIMVEILKRMQEKYGEYKREYIPSIVENINNLDLGIDNNISFNQTRHQGSDQIYYTTIKDYKYIPLTQWLFP